MKLSQTGGLENKVVLDKLFELFKLNIPISMPGEMFLKC